MSNYKKFTLDTIKQKLKNGDYEAAVGAMRAIGKTQELSEGDKEKARVLVRKHFGIEAPAPKAKKAAKKAASKAAKKAAAKPKAARAKKAAKPAAAAAPAKKTAKKASKKGKRSKPAAAATEGDTETSTSEAADSTAAKEKPAASQVAARVASEPGVLVTMGQVISTVSESIKAMETAKRMFPKGSFERDVEVATGVMARAVRTIDQSVVSPRLNESAPEAAGATPRKKAAKKGTRAKATPPAQVEEEALAQPNGVHDERELSEEEQEQLRLARASQPNAEG